MANPNPTRHHKRAFKQGWNDALKVKLHRRKPYKHPEKDTWMAIGFSFGDEVGVYDKQLFDRGWVWCVSEYSNGHRVIPSEFINQPDDNSLRQSVAIQTKIQEGVGFAQAEENRKVERSAIAFVTRQYEEQGWCVESVEDEKCGYDLECRKGEMANDVEVKGVTGTVQAFIITRKEVHQATTNPDFVIWIVTSALSTHAEAHYYSGLEFQRRFALEPIAYRVAYRESH